MEAPREKLEALITGDHRWQGPFCPLRTMIRRHGLAWLTDEQVRDLAGEVVITQRLSERANRGNRARRARMEDAE